MANYAKASVHPSELREFDDAQTGAHIYQLTNHASINHNLYFLTSSFTPDQGALVWSSHRSGKPNFFKAAFPDGDIVQLTDADDVHGYSGVIAKDGTQLFYTQADEIKAIHLETLAERTLEKFPGGSLGECSVSADEKFIVTAMKRDGTSHITVTATDGSGGEVIYTSPTQTVIHPQFHPKHAELIAYSGDPAPRMWTIHRDGTENRQLYEHGNHEFLVHETFLGAQNELIVTHWPYALRRFSLETLQMQTIADFNAWHIASNRAGTKVLCDTVHPDIGLRLVDVETGEHTPICYPQSSSSGSQWKTARYALAEDWAAAQQQADREKALSWMEMKVDTVYGPQWTHPHPSFSPDEKAVVYTSDVSGHPQVYVAEIP